LSRILVAPAALDDLEQLIATHSLPAGTPVRVRRSIEPLGDFPLLGASLDGRWRDYRFLLGPWRWLLIVYAYDRAADVVAVVTIQDARSSTAVTGAR
jgi:plasmid stabilization system protein ParE